jgi:hypothetical protein
MASELTGYGATGSTHYFVVYNATQQVWNGAAFEDFDTGSWTDYDITATEQGTSGYFVGSSPSASSVRYALRLRVSGTPAITDPTMWEDSLTSSSGDASASNQATIIKLLQARLEK